jgi:hypothetical protein
MPLEDGGQLNQHHHLKTARPQSVEPDPEQAVDRDQSEPTRPLATQNVAADEGEQGSPISERLGDGIGRARAATMERTCSSMPRTL